MDLLSGAETGAICRLSYGFMSIIRSNQRQVERPPAWWYSGQRRIVENKIYASVRLSSYYKNNYLFIEIKKLKCLRFPM